MLTHRWWHLVLVVVLAGSVPAYGQQRDHTVGLGVSYQPVAGPGVLASYEYAGWARSRLGLQGSWSERLSGAVRYARRLPVTGSSSAVVLSAELFSEFAPNRTIGGGTTDERRSGARIGLASHLGRRLLQAHVEAMLARVFLRPEGGVDRSEALVRVDAGASLAPAAAGLGTHQRLVVTSALHAGYAATTPYATLHLVAQARRALAGPLTLAIDARGAATTASTPDYDRATFGGQPTVRGYPPDAALGLGLWSLQTEVWTPLPGARRLPGTLGRLIHDVVRLAGYVDLGSVYGSVMMTGRLRTGLGVGARLLLGTTTVRLDWAHRGEEVYEGDLRGSFYVSATTAWRP